MGKYPEGSAMKYEIPTGKLFDENGLIGTGWAGQLAGKNNPAMQNVSKVGPLPMGTYWVGDPITHPRLGALGFPLTPDPANEMFSRADFYIHGANRKTPSISSEGCIIQMLPTREYIQKKIAESPKESPLRQLIVYNVE